jgi:hypothetical protein
MWASSSSRRTRSSLRPMCCAISPTFRPSCSSRNAARRRAAQLRHGRSGCSTHPGHELRLFFQDGVLIALDAPSRRDGIRAYRMFRRNSHPRISARGGRRAALRSFEPRRLLPSCVGGPVAFASRRTGLPPSATSRARSGVRDCERAVVEVSYAAYETLPETHAYTAMIARSRKVCLCTPAREIPCKTGVLGAIAQLGERLDRTQEVASSSLASSILQGLCCRRGSPWSRAPE